MSSLLKDARHIQAQFIQSKKQREPEDLARSFAKLIMEDKISAAIKMLDKEASTGILPLTNDVLQQLQEKHPDASPVEPNTLLHGPINAIPESFFENIDETTVFKASLD